MVRPACSTGTRVACWARTGLAQKRQRRTLGKPPTVVSLGGVREAPHCSNRSTDNDLILRSIAKRCVSKDGLHQDCFPLFEMAASRPSQGEVIRSGRKTLQSITHTR